MNNSIHKPIPVVPQSQPQNILLYPGLFSSRAIVRGPSFNADNPKKGNFENPWRAYKESCPKNYCKCQKCILHFGGKNPELNKGLRNTDAPSNLFVDVESLTAENKIEGKKGEEKRSEAELGQNNINTVRKPNCARCKAHGLEVLVKGHKIKCEYRSCLCKKCNVVVELRNVKKIQTKTRRGQTKQKEENIKQSMTHSQSFVQTPGVSSAFQVPFHRRVRLATCFQRCNDNTRCR